MEITIRYFEGCPNWKTAYERVLQVVRELDPAPRPNVVLEAVETADEADRVRFRGSPTILVEGVDPFVDESAPIGLSCRVYRTEKGLEGSPSLKQLREAITLRG